MEDQGENCRFIKRFSDEAFRLIGSGPAWKPEAENGKPVEDQVRLRVVFK
jgi:hypothetical protein